MQPESRSYEEWKHLYTQFCDEWGIPLDETRMNLGYQTWATDPHAPISDEEWRYTYNRWCDAMGIEPRQEIRQNNPCQGMTMEEFLSSNIEHFIPLDEMTRAYAKHYGVESIDLDAIKQQVNTDMEIDLDDSPDFGH